MTKNVVLVSFKYPPVYSGYGKQLKSVTETIIEKNEDIQFTLLTAFKDSNVKENNIKTVSFLPTFKNNNHCDLLLFSFRIFFWLLKNRKDYSTIHCVKAGPEAVVCNIISKMFNKPLMVKVVQNELSSDKLEDTNILQRIYRKSRLNFLKSSDYFIAISEEIESFLNKYTGDKSKVIYIPNGVDVEKFQPLKDNDQKSKFKQILNVPNDEIILLYIGSLNERKGTTDLLRAIQNIETDKKIRAIFCGPILENETKYLELKKSINNSKNIKVDFRGVVSKPEKYLNIADIFILPSYVEGLPNVLLEAGASGLPLVTTNIGGSRDIVEDNINGFIVETNSAECIAEKLEVLIEDKELRWNFGEKSRDKILKQFSLRKVSESYISLYEYI